MPVSKADLRVDWATHEAAKYACEHWHYSKCLPKSKLVKIGAWESGKFIGVVIFAYGATPNLSKPYGLTQDRCVELCRIALTSHKVEVSRIVKLSIMFLMKICPKLKLIVSFADTTQGHHGGIYQAGNWIYNGSSSEDTFYFIHGKLTHRRSMGSIGLVQNLKGAQTIDKNAKLIKVPGKHRYLMPLDDEMRAKIAPLAKPYPKRPKQAMTGDHPEQRQCNTDQDAPYSVIKIA